MLECIQDFLAMALTLRGFIAKHLSCHIFFHVIIREKACCVTDFERAIFVRFWSNFSTHTSNGDSTISENFAVL